MNEKTKTAVSVQGSDQAPFVYFDGVVTFGLIGGVVQIELAANCRVPAISGDKEQVISRNVITAHLRGSDDAMASLADAIDKALTMRKSPAKSGSANGG